MARFDDCLAFTLGPSVEGGYSDNPLDHGGATNRGITQVVYDTFRLRHGLPQQPVSGMTLAETEQIYAEDYWTPIQGNSLGAPVDLCMFDLAVNSGVGRAIQLLQETVGVDVDGGLGPVTLAATAALPPMAVAAGICDRREEFLKGIVARNPNQAIFLHGWINRVNAVRKAAGLPVEA